MCACAEWCVLRVLRCMMCCFPFSIPLFSTHGHVLENQTQWRRNKRNTADASQPNFPSTAKRVTFLPTHVNTNHVSNSMACPAIRSGVSPLRRLKNSLRCSQCQHVDCASSVESNVCALSSAPEDSLHDPPESSKSEVFDRACSKEIF